MAPDRPRPPRPDHLHGRPRRCGDLRGRRCDAQDLADAGLTQPPLVRGQLVRRAVDERHDAAAVVLAAAPARPRRALAGRPRRRRPAPGRPPAQARTSATSAHRRTTRTAGLAVQTADQRRLVPVAHRRGHEHRRGGDHDPLRRGSEATTGTSVIRAELSTAWIRSGTSAGVSSSSHRRPRRGAATRRAAPARAGHRSVTDLHARRHQARPLVGVGAIGRTGRDPDVDHRAPRQRRRHGGLDGHGDRPQVDLVGGAQSRRGHELTRGHRPHGDESAERARRRQVRSAGPDDAHARHGEVAFGHRSARE